MGDEDELNVARACADKQADRAGQGYDPMLADLLGGRIVGNAQASLQRVARKELASNVYGRRFALRMVLDGLDQGCTTDEIRRACDILDQET